MKSTHHDYKAIFVERVGIIPLDMLKELVHKLIGNNHPDLTGINALDSSLHNHHTMLDHSWEIYAFIGRGRRIDVVGTDGICSNLS